jgi:hypothetical protein
VGWGGCSPLTAHCSHRCASRVLPVVGTQCNHLTLFASLEGSLAVTAHSRHYTPGVRVGESQEEEVCLLSVPAVLHDTGT